MAFHPYPGVVPALFNGRGCGPPRGLTPASPCPGVARPASRPRPATARRPVRTRLRCGSAQPSPRRRPRLAGSFFNRHAVTPRGALRLLAGARFQALFHSPPGPYLIPATLGFLLVGFGISSSVPICYSIAGKLGTIKASIAITIVSSISFFGFLVGPPVIGWLAEATGLRIAISIAACLGLMIAFVAAKVGKRLS